MPKPVYRPFATIVFAAALSAGAMALPDTANAQNSGDSAPSAGRQEGPVIADPVPATPAILAGRTYADLVDLAQRSPVVAKAVIHRQSRLKIEQSPGLPAGFARLYIEADTAGVLVGPELGESLRLLADVPLDANGKVPKLVKTPVLLFGNVVSGKPGELLLTASDTIFAWSPALEARMRAILTELVDPDAPPRITGLREALHVPGNLAGEGETQFFFATDSGKPVSISVVRRPGEAPRWGVSFGEIVDQAARPPHPETLAWYRLACALPDTIPGAAAISTGAANKRIAAEDYALILRDLGPCRRMRPTRTP